MAASGKFGRIQPAPENFISAELIDQIRDHGLNDSRREFLRKGFAAASAALAAPRVARAQDTFRSAKAGYRLVTLSRDLEQLANAAIVVAASIHQ